MTENNDEKTRQLTDAERREFLARAAHLAVAAPAATLLLAASANAQQAPQQAYAVQLQPSDRRLKRDIVRAGTLRNGLPLYTFRYSWSSTRFVGVMADEVEQVLPGAVSVHASGYKLVDYGQIIG
jgi:hypothetical protein